MPAKNYQLSLLKISVSTIERSTDFYRDVLGFQEQFRVAEYGWAQLQAGELPIALYQAGMGGGDGAVGGSVSFHLSLPSEQFDTLADELLRRGVLVENQVHHSDDGSIFVEVYDPDNNTLKIVRGE